MMDCGPREEIIRLVHARSASLVNRDVETLEQILHPDFIYTNSYGKKTHRNVYLARFANNNSGPRWERQDISQLELYFHGHTAVVTCQVHDVMIYENTRIDASFQATFVYIRTQESWVCIAGHSSSIVED